MVVCSKEVSRCPLVLCKHVLEANLEEFNLLGFDIILKMDWLSYNYVCINCHSQIVNFESLGGEIVEFLDTKLRTRPVMISMVQAKKDLACGA